MAVLMILPAVILKHYFHQDLKNWQVLLTPLITIVLYISGLSKLDEWMSTKKKNTCIELMELISKQNNIIRKIEKIHQYELTTPRWIRIEEDNIDDRVETFTAAFDELYNERFDINLEINEKIKTLRILNVKIDHIIDELIFSCEVIIEYFDEWNRMAYGNFDPYDEYPITLYHNHLNKIKLSLKDNTELQLKYTEKDFNKLFIIN